MLKLPKGLKKKKKKSKKDQELFTEEELEQYKRDLKAKQEAAATKSDAGESDGAASDVEVHHEAAASNSSLGPGSGYQAPGSSSINAHQPPGDQCHGAAGGDEEWAKFKALTSGVDSILHKTQDELDRIKKESFYQRLPSAAEKKKQEEEEAARLVAEQQERERQRLGQIEAQRDKLAEAVVQLSESEEETGDYEADDIFATDYIEAITSGELQLAVVPDSPVLAEDGPDPFDTAYAEKVIVGADRAKSNKKLVSLGAAVEVLSGRVDREHAVALANPKRKLRKGIQNLLLSESVELADSEADLLAAAADAKPQHNLLDDLDEELLESSAPIDLSVSLHLHLIKHKPVEEEEQEEQDQENQLLNPNLSEFDELKDDEDDEFAELAAESLTKKEEVTIVSQVVVPAAELPTEAFGEGSWAEFEAEPEPESGKPKRPPPPVRPPTGPHIVPGAIYVSDDEEENPDDDPFNTNYADQVIKKSTVLEEDDDFDPRAEEETSASSFLVSSTRDLLAGSATDLSQVVPAPLAPTLSVDQEPEDFDPFDTSAVSALVQPKATELRFLERVLFDESGEGGATLKHSLSDPDFDPRADQDRPAEPQVKVEQIQTDFDTARRKSSLSLNIQAKSVGFLVPAPDLLGAGNELGANKKPLTPYYAPTGNPLQERERETEDVDPFDTSYVPEAKLSEIELKHIEKDLISEPTNLRHSLSDPDFDPRAPPTPVPAELLLAVEENINIKVLTPAQERKKLTNSGGSGGSEDDIDPFDTSIAANLGPGRTELKLLENELLPETKPLVTDVLDVQSDAQELGLGDKVLTPSTHSRPVLPFQDIDPFDTSIAENLAPGETEIKLLESELIER
ncbi:protein stoned-A [Drosophila eugracilis]|uniref:protein stoned-A n=1 Tax=Drosophila eugracilis TaxID=29029 RepID=UPI0007E7C247|nr:protein stoned-A [Drosophila eugracilis]XP_017062841.1 protein stoned-A [Drosophila eugracilis]XP_017062842.1 protein stoned-A [Drosophila eugracilis]XP_017062843.1 protein stoned-A [Drosophila eugracilis]XP_017062844.1 protein stoned-A [Drosophila eugracilis]XP_017062845.1 protein stoned-A [Drosophila eugracilis]XP_017062846.1 protein stoned-A [Drosophila eugracilis]XP_017062847.1 protein stoned-A [Drosophila eugracilis]XP_017062848.1 protein stoned-A [Drosophila eugracilis]